MRSPPSPTPWPFSDEACTSGQLVVASRESQYKIFHFHHGGLDKLSEVFQQWKFCTETHLRDQVARPTVGRDMVGYGQGNGSSSLRMPNTWVWDHSSTLPRGCLALGISL